MDQGFSTNVQNDILNEKQIAQIIDQLLQNKNEYFQVIKNEKYGKYYAVNNRKESYLIYLISIDDGNNSYCFDKLQQAQNYVDLVRGCDNLYISKIYDAFKINKFFVILFKDCDFSLSSYKCFDRNQLIQLAEQMIEAIIYLHSKNIFLKTFQIQKIFVDNNFNLKITEISFPKLINCQTEYGKYQQYGQPGIYLPPEILNQFRSNQFQKLIYKTIEQDIWSFGVWLLILSGSSESSIKNLTEGLEMYPLNIDIDFDINYLISLILQKEADQRPSLKQIKDYFQCLKLNYNKQNKQIILNQNSQFLIAQSKFVEKEFQKSFEIIQELVYKNPYNDEYLAWMGRICYALEKYEISEYFCYQTLKLNKENDLAYFILGINNTHYEFLELAKVYYQKAIQINPNNILALNNLGLAFQHSNQFEFSLQTYQNALKISPNDIDILNNQGTLFYKLGQYEKAIASFKKALRINSEHNSSYFNLGMLYLKMQKYNKSIKYFESLVKMTPLDNEALFHLGFSYKQVQNHQKSLKYFYQALKIAPQKAKYLFNIGQVYMEKLLKQKSYTYLQRSLQLKPLSEKYVINLGVFYLQFEPERALQHFISSFQRFQQNEKICNYLGICYSNQNQLESAFECYKKAYSLDQKNSFAVMNMNIVKNQIQKQKQVKNPLKIFLIINN
ncbi:tetratricopeptide repeat protein (macronuclear) [Tetrahymena thermophila SB210]|uniref:Tetratricopeptide repeat protein n=1 Tax=Tetrahymena thermophila (strain SB210) TaxID=312017 RepID=I7M429_TETTS|nr:tetratricopeptide repeat protein [Tetrahymena thermophila SB210]EAS04791.1 tetratricopeptide repeat protein [Tetrahymena thermophila SB210]|eukprot:XP_001025036.1 tetratricopeptide repeat protein [Tetrahymena thermophila SB210]